MGKGKGSNKGKGTGVSTIKVKANPALANISGASREAMEADVGCSVAPARPSSLQEMAALLEAGMIDKPSFELLDSHEMEPESESVP